MQEHTNRPKPLNVPARTPSLGGKPSSARGYSGGKPTVTGQPGYKGHKPAAKK